MRAGNSAYCSRSLERAAAPTRRSQQSKSGPEPTLDDDPSSRERATKNGIDIIDLVREMRSVEDKNLSLQKIWLSSAVNESIKLNLEKWDSKNITMDVNIPDEYYIMAEPRSFINSVVNNIVTDAIKFSHKDSTVFISAGKSDKGIFVSFKDTGIGIPGKLLDKLFDVSKKTNRPGTSGEKGTGFGMPQGAP